MKPSTTRVMVFGEMVECGSPKAAVRVASRVHLDTVLSAIFGAAFPLIGEA